MSRNVARARLGLAVGHARRCTPCQVQPASRHGGGGDSGGDNDNDTLSLDWRMPGIEWRTYMSRFLSVNDRASSEPERDRRRPSFRRPRMSW
jgi:hypothetical protein